MLLALALVLGSGSAPVLPCPDGATEFANELQAIEKLVAAGKGEKARPLLDVLLEAHREARYVFPRILELRELHSECAFQASYDAPAPGDLISGDLVQWKPSSGKIEVVYKENKRRRRFLDLGDFVGSDRSDRFHPLHFEGAFQMEIRGRMPESVNTFQSPPSSRDQ